MLQKKNGNKNAYYNIGDKISFRTTDSKRKLTGTILGLKDSTIVFNGFEVSLKEISSLYIDEKTKWWLRFKIEQLCLRAGAIYMIVDVLNTGQLSSQTMLISGTLIGAGLIAKALIGNQVKIRGRTKLRILKL